MAVLNKRTSVPTPTNPQLACAPVELFRSRKVWIVVGALLFPPSPRRSGDRKLCVVDLGIRRSTNPQLADY